MAFIAEQKKEQGQEIGNPQGGQSAFIGGSGVPAGGSKPATAGSGYTNLSKYLEVNDGGGISQAIDSKVASETESFNKASDGFKSNIATDVTKGTKVDTNNVAGQLGKSPTQVKQQDYTNLTSGYGGPSMLSKVTGYNGFETAYGQADNNLNGLRNSETQVGLVADAAKKDLNQGLNYNRGMGNLDKLFLQDQQPKINANIDKASQGLVNAKSAIGADFDTRVTQAKTTSDATAATVSGARTDAKDAITRAGQNRMGTFGPVNPNSINASGASLGDALGDNERADLEALAGLGGEAYDESWYKRTYNPGETVVSPLVSQEANPLPNVAPSRSGIGGVRGKMILK